MQSGLEMYKTGALIVGSSKLLLPALTAAARLVSGVLYVPLNFFEKKIADVGGARGQMSEEEEGVVEYREGDAQLIGYEAQFLCEASKQVQLKKLMCKLLEL